MSIKSEIKWRILFGLYLIPNAAHSLGKKIESKAQLEMIVDEEARKLGLDPLAIDVRYQTGRTSASRDNDRYIVQISSPYRTRAGVRHELYHVLKDVDRENRSDLNFWLLRQPRAMIYGLLRIRL